MKCNLPRTLTIYCSLHPLSNIEMVAWILTSVNRAERKEKREVPVVDCSMEETEGEQDYSEEASVHQRIEQLCQCIEAKQRMVKLKREELRK